MKTKIHTLLFLLISIFAFNAVSQTADLNPENSKGQNIAHIKAIKGIYLDGKVYLHIHVNGNTETRILAVESSLDAIKFEVIGYLNINGTTATTDIAYYFTDESPVAEYSYYRLSYYSIYGELVCSETINVISIDENKDLASITNLQFVLSK
ncbi:MAG: hypothetical protein PHD97_08915 [Bacteroidales bacterium]|nr:hypothetical protein [Bacteroidales bacterium]